jgi:hypothetical protein
VHRALLLTVALRIEPNPPVHGEPATLIVDSTESAPLRITIGQAAMLRRIPQGATLNRDDSGAELLWMWSPAPQGVTCELVLRADASADWLNVHASAGMGRADLGVKPVSREAAGPARPALSCGLIAAGLALSTLLWPTWRLLWRHSKTVAVIGSLFGTVLTVVFVQIWWSDYAATPDYRQRRCVVTDRMLVYRGSERSSRFYTPMVAAEVDDGRTRIAGDGDGWTYGRDDAWARLQKFETGRSYPCWYSMRDRDELLLEPRRKTIILTTLGTLVALTIMALPGLLTRGRG